MTEATRIIAVRHGETAWNRDKRIQGSLDIGLNDTGRWQAQRLALALAEEHIDRIYSSDLSRAHATAQAIAGATGSATAREVFLHPGLRERGFGSFEGQTYTQIEADWPDASRRWRQREPHFAPPGGETPVQVHVRVSRTLAEIAHKHRGGQIVLVAHGGVLDALYRMATGQDISAPRTWELGNAAINRLLWTPEALTLVGWADARHLEETALDEASP